MNQHFPQTARMNDIKHRIITWFKSSGRSFPWRKTNNAFHILIAEMMLRRTTAKAVERVYSRFIKKYATVKQLSSASIDQIAKQVESLGLQNTRAKHLIDMACVLKTKHNSSVPEAEKQLLSLSGVGKYVASAVRNFAFHKSVPLVDGNILHFLKRVFSREFKNAYDPLAWDFMRQFGDPHHSSFYLGIIDLVAMICLRKSPKCDECPISSLCDYYG